MYLAYYAQDGGMSRENRTRGQKSEVRGQRSGIRGQGSEDKGPEVRGQKPGVGGRMKDDERKVVAFWRPSSYRSLPAFGDARGDQGSLFPPGRRGRYGSEAFFHRFLFKPKAERSSNLMPP